MAAINDQERRAAAVAAIMADREARRVDPPDEDYLVAWWRTLEGREAPPEAIGGVPLAYDAGKFLAADQAFVRRLGLWAIESWLQWTGGARDLWRRGVRGEPIDGDAIERVSLDRAIYLAAFRLWSDQYNPAAAATLRAAREDATKPKPRASRPRRPNAPPRVAPAKVAGDLFDDFG